MSNRNSNPFKAPRPFKTQELHKSTGILDDYAVRKAVLTREGTITHTPSSDNDIVNKKYVDDMTSQFAGINVGTAYDYADYTYTGYLMTHAVYKTGGSAGTIVCTADLTYNVRDVIETITLDKSGVVTVETYAYTYNGNGQILTSTKT